MYGTKGRKKRSEGEKVRGKIIKKCGQDQSQTLFAVTENIIIIIMTFINMYAVLRESLSKLSNFW